jgi:CheY-like chemotaxis protein
MGHAPGNVFSFHKKIPKMNFLDFSMPLMDGFEFLEELSPEHFNPRNEISCRAAALFQAYRQQGLTWLAIAGS